MVRMPKTPERFSKRCDEAARRSRVARAASRALARAPLVRSLAASIVALALTHAGTALADPRRLAVLGAGPSLRRSVDVALDPWDVEVILFDEAPPDPSAPDFTTRATDFARAHGVDAIAWFRLGDDESTLWLFDAASRVLEQRTLGAAALADSARDASMALSLKTLLRSRAWRAPPVGADAEAGRETTSAERTTRLDVALAVRGPVSGSPAEPRLEVGATTWLGHAPAWGAGLAVAIGPGVTLAEESASGTRVDAALRASLRARVAVVGPLAIEPRVGASLHVEETRLSLRDGTTDAETRVDPSLDAGLALVWSLSRRLDAAVGVEALYGLRYQRWLTFDRVIFAPSPLALQSAAALAWSF